MQRTLTFSILAALTWSNVSAEEKFRQLDSHVHGHGSLNIAIEGKVVEMELEVPGADIVGFEHKPGNSEEEAAIKAALEKLKQGGALFQFPSDAKCDLERSTAELVTENDGHNHKHDTEKHGDHKTDRHKEEHAEFVAYYRFGCADPDQITELRLPYFDAFPNSEELEIQMISRRGTRGFEVERANPVLVLPN